MKRKKVFYIEDEPALGKIVKDTLEKQGYDVLWETDGAKVTGRLTDYSPDVCVIDIMLPNIDGFSLARTIRGTFKDLPVIFLTARTATEDVIKGFESGGTDYLKKPFSIMELIVRIENQLTLSGKRSTGNGDREMIKIGKFNLDPVRYELLSATGIVKLSNRDMQVIRMLYANRNKLTPRKDLLLTVWGDDSYFNSRNLDVYIRKIRRYFSDDQGIKIITLKGSGYLFLMP